MTDGRGHGARRIGLAGVLLAVGALAPASLAGEAPTLSFTQGAALTADRTGQTLRVGVSGTTSEPLYVSVVYYRGARGVCGATPQQVTGTRIVDQVQVGPGAFNVRRTSPRLALGLWTVCGYAFRGTPPDNLFFVDGSGDVAGIDPTGGGTPGGAPTAVAIAAAPQGARYVFAGTTAGTKTGTVRVQRRVGSTWRTIATAAVRNGRWRAVAPARAGWTVRALLTAAGKQPSRSAPRRLR
jgi:hypothetical protein